MAPTKAREKSPADKFVQAVSRLKDITAFHTAPKLASMRANLMHDDAISHDGLRSLEVLGIANAVAARFRSTPQHHANATEAVFSAAMLSDDVRSWFVSRDTRADVPVLGESDDGYRAILLTHLDWVHKYSTIRDCASADMSTRLCPVTTYLQLILCETPMEDWAAAAAGAEPEASPPAFAWAWARKSPGVGRQTADVVALVTMGRHVYRLMVDEPVRLEELRSSAAAENMTKFASEGFWAALSGAVKDRLIRATARRQTSRTISAGSSLVTPKISWQLCRTQKS